MDRDFNLLEVLGADAPNLELVQTLVRIVLGERKIKDGETIKVLYSLAILAYRAGLVQGEKLERERTQGAKKAVTTHQTKERAAWDEGITKTQPIYTPLDISTPDTPDISTPDTPDISTPDTPDISSGDGGDFGGGGASGSFE